MGQRYTYSKKREKHIVVILHIYGTRAIFLLFRGHQDTEYKWYEIEMSISKPIFTQKNTKVIMGQWYPYSTIWEKNIAIIIHISGAWAIFYYYVITIFLLFCIHQDTSLSNEKWKLVYINQYSPRKRHSIYRTSIFILYKMGYFLE